MFSFCKYVGASVNTFRDQPNIKKISSKIKAEGQFFATEWDGVKRGEKVPFRIFSPLLYQLSYPASQGWQSN